MNIFLDDLNHTYWHIAMQPFQMVSEGDSPAQTGSMSKGLQPHLKYGSGSGCQGVSGGLAAGASPHGQGPSQSRPTLLK